MNAIPSSPRQVQRRSVIVASGLLLAGVSAFFLCGAASTTSSTMQTTAPVAAQTLTYVHKPSPLVPLTREQARRHSRVASHAIPIQSGQ